MQFLKSIKIVLGVTGGIDADKSCPLTKIQII